MHWTCSRFWIALAAVAALSLLPSASWASNQSVTFTPGAFPDHWLTGGPDCSELQQDFQIHRYNTNLYILREAGCVHHEKPFLFLLFGQDKALLLDTGAGPNTDPVSGRQPDVRSAVDFVIGQWLKQAGRTSIPLVVVHLHSHFDHVWGDPQFIGRPDTTFVPPGSVAVLKSFFGITSWPEQIVPYDLGKRVLDIIPTPGHDDTELAIYDRQTALLLVGDTLYPGRLYINGTADEFQASVQRMLDFTADKPVAHVLGTHIERTPCMGCTDQRDAAADGALQPAGAARGHPPPRQGRQRGPEDLPGHHDLREVPQLRPDQQVSRGPAAARRREARHAAVASCWGMVK